MAGASGDEEWLGGGGCVDFVYSFEGDDEAATFYMKVFILVPGDLVFSIYG